LTTESERRVKILEYVKERQEAKQNTTKAIVIRYMKDKRLASRETTHYLINDLISEGKLNKKEINSQVHFLTINYENEFNKIYNTLSEIENIIPKINEPFRKWQEMHPPDIDLSREFSVLMDHLVLAYLDVMPILFQEILTRIKNKIHSDIDKEILYSRILQLQQQYIEPFGMKPRSTASEKLGSSIARLGDIRSNDPSLARIKQRYANFVNECDAVARQFEIVLKNFRKEFLT
jgi:hypothetical protein